MKNIFSRYFLLIDIKFMHKQAQQLTAYRLLHQLLLILP